MKICIIGLGSIGKRHLINMTNILRKRKISYVIDALKSGKGDVKEDIIGLISKEYFSYEDLPCDYDVIFITNPTFLHYETLCNIIDKTKHLFIEKPVFDRVDYDIKNINLVQDHIYYVACPIRHKEIIQYAKKLVESEDKIISARVICSSYLPKWRPGVDYRNVYSSQAKLGGGVSIDLIHEWDYLTYLFGIPLECYNIKGHYSNLELDCDDISIYIAKYIDKVVEVHLDYIGQKSERKLELYTNQRRIDIDLLNNEITSYKDYKVENHLIFEKEDFYINEMEYFFDCISGVKKNINTIENALSVLSLVQGNKQIRE